MPRVALTFDDGPNPPRTEQILEILDEKGIRASFFVIGRLAERFPRTLDRIVAAGHVVGNHSHRHVRHLSDFERAQAAIGHITGQSCSYARQPYGDFASLARSVLVEDGELTCVDADVNPDDWRRLESEEIIRATLDAPELASGSIIDLHDSSEFDDDAARLTRPLPLIEALPSLIDEIRRRGLELVGLDELDLVEPSVWAPPDAATQLAATGREVT